MAKGPAGVAQLVDCRQVHGNIAGSVPGQGPYLGFGFSPQVGHIRNTTDWCFSSTLMFLSFPLSKQVLR